MKKITMYFALLAFVFLQACGGGGGAASSDLVDLIPANAIGVMSVDIGQMMKKAEYEQLKQTEAMKEAAQKSELAKKIIDNPSESGIDLNQRMFAFALLKEGSFNEPGFAAFLIPLADVAKFEALLEQAPDAPEEQQKDGYKMRGANDAIVAWSESVVAIVPEPERFSDSEAQLQAIFSGGSKGSIKKAPGFKRAMGETHDLIFWATADPIAAFVKEMGQSPLAAAGFEEDALEDNFISFYVDYEKGAAKAGSFYGFNKSLREDVGSIFKSSPDIDLGKYAPSADLLGHFHISLSPEGINKTLEKGGRGMIAKSFLSNQGIGLDDILKGMGGDIFVAAYGNPDNPEVLVVLSVGDKEAMARVLQVLMDTQRLPLIMEDGKYKLRSGDGTMQEVVLTDEALAISTNAEWLAKIQGGGFGGDGLEMNELEDAIMGMHINMAKLGDAASGQPLGGMPGLVGAAAMGGKDLFSEMFLYFKSDEAMANMKMKNSDRNSLAIIIEQAIKAQQESPY